MVWVLKTHALKRGSAECFSAIFAEGTNSAPIPSLLTPYKSSINAHNLVITPREFTGIYNTTTSIFFINIIFTHHFLLYASPLHINLAPPPTSTLPSIHTYFKIIQIIPGLHSYPQLTTLVWNAKKNNDKCPKQKNPSTTTKPPRSSPQQHAPPNHHQMQWLHMKTPRTTLCG